MDAHIIFSAINNIIRILFFQSKNSIKKEYVRDHNTHVKYLTLNIKTCMNNDCKLTTVKHKN